MELTKHTHACVTFDKGGSRLLVDPGAFTPNAAELAASAGTILITHEHFDHFDEEAIAAALQARPELRVYGQAAVVDRWEARRGQVTAVTEGERFDVDGFDVAVFGGLHAAIHRDIPQVANVGYLIDGHVYHPGDSYFVPAGPGDHAAGADERALDETRRGGGLRPGGQPRAGGADPRDHAQ